LTIGKIGIIPGFLIILILFSGCATEKAINNSKEMNLFIETEVELSKKPELIELSEEEKLDLEAEALINKMSIDEKIGQMFILSVRNSFNGTRMLYADDYMKHIIETYKPGGIIFFTINFANPTQTRNLLRDTQKLSGIPLFMAIDEEGGKVARLGNTDRMSVTKLPPAAVIGNTGNTEYARMASHVISKELKAYGFNMNMAPVADVNTNLQNPVIGNRTYSSDPYEAGMMVAAVTEAMAEDNMISVLKHFPGHGDSSADSHKGDVIVGHDKDRLENIEFVPFSMGIEVGADAVMTAHIKVPNVTENDMPATMSSVLLQDILRKELGFNGLIITDAMDMGAVKQNWPADEAAVNAILAGVDIILIPASVKDAIKGIKNALDEGILTMDRIDESVHRIIKVKVKRRLFSNESSGSDELMSIIGSEKHKEIIRQISQ